MRIVFLTFILSTILPNLSWAVPVKYEYSGTITRHITEILIQESEFVIYPEEVFDDSYGSSMVTDAIPIGTQFSGSFFHDSDLSDYLHSYFFSNFAFANGEFAFGLANVSLNLPSGNAQVKYIGNPCGGPSPISGITMLDGVETNSDGKLGDSIRLEAGGFFIENSMVHNCGIFDSTGLSTGDFRPTLITLLGREKGNTNPDYITDTSTFPENIDEVINSADESLFMLGFEIYDGDNLTPVNELVHVSVIGSISVKRAAIPEPAPIALFVIGLLGAGVLRKRKS